MIEEDTVKMLRKCDSGIKMGVGSISDVLDHVNDEKLRDKLTRSKEEHEKLGTEINSILESYSDEGKNPNPVIKGMSWIKTNVTLAINGSDSRVAELIMDGCNMGVKSLSRYLNQYKAADEQSKDIAKRLIELEDRLSTDMRGYL